ncbi:MAG: hypothetical protein AUH85_04625 [Chloroflexi bacterium 13_1_40CM_4_68_4]|nr:MAG: hypothetical protein AUH85_04625 [Chloroflexi bacterium 13_1_40CM_4_68_4]
MRGLLDVRPRGASLGCADLDADGRGIASSLEIAASVGETPGQRVAPGRERRDDRHDEVDARARRDRRWQRDDVAFV